MTVLIPLCLLFCEPADPEFRRKAWDNVTDTGFISREYFQAVVTVPMPNQEKPLLELREECKARALRKRDEISVPILATQLREEKRYLQGTAGRTPVPSYIPPAQHPQVGVTGVAVSPGAATASLTPNQPAQSTATSPQSQQQPTSNPSDTTTKENASRKKEAVNADFLAYRAAFSWFFEGFFLYREDYSDPKNCTFVYRIVQANLLKRILESPIYDLPVR
ncbi:hypothetical protein EHO60_14910 [Leptospira fletcheri]|uniref:Uncharacterized protein n=1 Tax=Leptospira fletcheri TaxID=2484981 RepID=A0A4R9G5A1_9LEPT|nr:hypothetical protein EHO60_14910 [Leptospira fletcheri]